MKGQQQAPPPPPPGLCLTLYFAWKFQESGQEARSLPGEGGAPAHLVPLKTQSPPQSTGRGGYDPSLDPGFLAAPHAYRVEGC